MVKYFLICILSVSLFSSCNGPSASAESSATMIKPSKAQAKTPKMVKNKPGTKVRPIEGAMQINLNEIEATAGSEACVSLTTSSFNNILGIQYSVNFNPQHLKFKESKNYGLKGLNKGNFGANKANMGHINFLWFDMNVKGITVPNNTVLYDLCFDILAKSGTSCAIEITDTPTKIEIVGPNKSKLALESSAGKITVK